MKIRLGDREYPVVGPRGANGQLRGGMTMQALFDLRRQSVEVFGFEVGLGKLDELTARARRAKAQRVAALKAGDEDGARAADASVVDDGLVNIAIVTFLSMRAAGEHCTLADVAAYALDDIEWIREPGDPEGDDVESPDPTQPGTAAASPVTHARAAGKPRPRKTSSRGRGKTSSSPSVTG